MANNHPRTVLSGTHDLGRCGLLGRGELAQIVDVEAFFDIGDFVDHPLEAGPAEAPMLLVFKVSAMSRNCTAGTTSRNAGKQSCLREPHAARTSG